MTLKKSESKGATLSHLWGWWHFVELSRIDEPPEEKMRANEKNIVMSRSCLGHGP
jgi:hypothetical protein